MISVIERIMKFQILIHIELNTEIQPARNITEWQSKKKNMVARCKWNLYQWPIESVRLCGKVGLGLTQPYKTGL